MKVRTHLHELFDPARATPADQIASLLIQEPNEHTVRQVCVWLAVLQERGEYFIDEWQKKPDASLDLASLGIAVGSDPAQKIQADLAFMISIIASQMSEKSHAEFERLIHLGIRSYHNAMRLHDGDNLMLSNIVERKKPQVLELSSALLQGEVKNRVDRGIVRRLLVVAGAVASGRPLAHKLTLVVPSAMAEDQLLSSLVKLDSRLGHLKGRVDIVSRDHLTDGVEPSVEENSGAPPTFHRLSVRKLLQQLSQNGIQTSNGVDLFILNRSEWTDPDRGSLVQMLVILTDDLVYDATTRVNDNVRTLIHIRLQA